MKNKQKIYGRYFSILCGILTIAGTFLPWVLRNGREYTIYQFLQAVNGGEMSQFAAENPGFYPTYLLTYFSIISIVFCVIRTVLLILNRKNRIIDNIMFFGQVVFFTGYVIFQGYNPGVGVIVVMLIIFIDFLVVLYCEQSYEIHMKYFQMKKREREEKEERKRRLYFPGKYPKEFGRVIRENFLSKWKNYVLFIMTGVLSATFLMVIIGINHMLKGTHSAESVVLGTGMQQILIKAFGLVFFITLFLTSYVLSYYIKSRISDYKMFVVMGIRKKTLSIIIAVEYVGSLIISFLIAMGLGTGLLAVIRKLLVQKFGNRAEIMGFSPSIYLWALIGYGVIVLIATAVNHESYMFIRDSFSETGYVDKEKIPGRFLILWVLLGLDCVLESIVEYSEVSIWGALEFLLGTYLIMTMGRALLMKWTDKSPRRYFGHVLEKIPFYYRFKRSSRYMILLTAIHFFVLGIYLIHLGSSMIAAPETEILPYDFVLMAHEEDSDILEKIEKEYGAEIKEYPMFRVTSPAGSSFDFMAKVLQYTPMGQHIGISESTYRQLYSERGLESPESLDLGENDIHVVFQQDSSFKIRSLDISTSAQSPNLKIGSPASTQYYEPRNVKSNEINILTGMLQRGSQENLIVFPDSRFEKEAAKVKGETNRLCLIQVPKEHYKAVDAQMDVLRERHHQDEKYDVDIRVCYAKQQMINDIASERYTKEVLYICVILMLAACAWFLTYIKFSFDAKEMCYRYRFLDDMGMHEKEKRKTIGREMWPFARIPLIVSAVGAVVFTIQLFRVRMYQPEQILSYVKTAGVIGIGYAAVQIFWMWCMVYQMKKKIKG